MWIDKIKSFISSGGAYHNYKVETVDEMVNEWMSRNTDKIIIDIKCYGDSCKPVTTVHYKEYKA